MPVCALPRVEWSANIERFDIRSGYFRGRSPEMPDDEIRTVFLECVGSDSKLIFQVVTSKSLLAFLSLCWQVQSCSFF